MHPVLWRISFLHVTLWSFGAMAVIGFAAALLLTRRMCRRVGLDPVVISNAALYCLIVGMVGARAFFVIHYLDQFRDDPLSVVAVWHGGLEFVGGAVPAVIFLLLYLRYHKLPVRRYLDILAVGLMLGLAFGRIGCFLNGCCFGRPTDLPWGVRFPYGSYAYMSQVNPDPARGRAQPYLNLPRERYMDFADAGGKWYPKPLTELTPRQRNAVTEGRYRAVPVHPTQLYASANALLLCGILYMCWRKSSVPPVHVDIAPQHGPERQASGGATRSLRARLWRPGLTFAVAFVLYGATRPVLESLRDDNPFEFDGLTISQIAGGALFVLGIALLIAHLRARPDS